jgi:hypothetical protein
MLPIIISITPAAAPGHSEARCNGRLLCVSRQPHLDGARALLALGCSPQAVIVTRRGNIDCLRSTVGAAARLTIKEKDAGNGPSFARWNAFSPTPVAPPIAPADRPATLVHLHGSASA